MMAPALLRPRRWFIAALLATVLFYVVYVYHEEVPVSFSGWREQGVGAKPPDESASRLRPGAGAGDAHKLGEGTKPEDKHHTTTHTTSSSSTTSTSSATSMAKSTSSKASTLGAANALDTLSTLRTLRTLSTSSMSASGKSSATSISSSAASPTRRPAWISTPPTFETHLIPDYDEVTFAAAALLPGRPLALHPSLAAAMSTFLTRPILTHTQARAQNLAACPVAQLHHQVNSDQLGGDHAKWLAVDPSRIVSMRLAALSFLESRSETEGQDALIGPGFGPDGATPVVPGSRGIVFAAGNHNTVAKAVACIRELRRLGWTEKDGAIEVFHFEGELTDEAQRAELEKLGATPRVVSVRKTPGRWKNYELKAEAMLRSSFDEVLYLDSDNFPLGNVRKSVFEEPLFRDDKGGRAVFWPDLNRDHPDNAVHRLLGVPCHDAWQLDSGQVALAKTGNGGLNLAALHLAQHMAEVEEPDEESGGGYWFSGGDKDTFRYAFLALALPYTPAPRWLSVVGGGEGRDFCGAGMLQYGLSAPEKRENADPQDPTHPTPLFLHANLLKHQGGQSKGKLSKLRRLAPTQDDVRLEYPPETALHSARGGGAEMPGKGLCSDIVAFRAGADVETVDAKEAYGGWMKDVEEEYFRYPGTNPGAWKRELRTA